MDAHGTLYSVLLVLAAAVVAVPLVQRLKASPVVGYLAAGIVIGPHATGLVRDGETVHLLAELGVVFLLFSIGLELSVERLKVMGRKLYIFGLLQIGLTLAALAAVAMALGLPLGAAIVVGAGLALSSTAVVLKKLTDAGELVTRFGRTALAALLLQDIAVGPLLVLVGLLGTDAQGGLLTVLGVTAAKAVGALLVIYLAGRYVVRPMFRHGAKLNNHELFSAMVLLVVLAHAALTEVAGLSMALGAFLAGVMLSETEYRHQIEADIRPFHGLLLGLFFMTVGMTVDLSVVVAEWPLILAGVVGLMTIKGAVIYGIGRFLGFPAHRNLRLALTLNQGGEFAFILLGLAVALSVVPGRAAELLVPIVALSMAVAPFLIRFGRRMRERMEKLAPGTLDELEQGTENAKGHILVLGCGRVGQIVSRLAKSHGLEVVALETDPKAIQKARREGLPVFFGDATRADVLRAAHTDRAALAVVTLQGGKMARDAVELLKHHYPDLTIHARAADHEEVARLMGCGATLAVPEVMETGLRLGTYMLTASGIEDSKVETDIARFRRADNLLMQQLLDSEHKSKA